MRLVMISTPGVLLFLFTDESTNRHSDEGGSGHLTPLSQFGCEAILDFHLQFRLYPDGDPINLAQCMPLQLPSNLWQPLADKESNYNWTWHIELSSLYGGSEKREGRNCRFNN